MARLFQSVLSKQVCNHRIRFVVCLGLVGEVTIRLAGFEGGNDVGIAAEFGRQEAEEWILIVRWQVECLS